MLSLTIQKTIKVKLCILATNSGQLCRSLLEAHLAYFDYSFLSFSVLFTLYLRPVHKLHTFVLDRVNDWRIVKLSPSNMLLSLLPVSNMVEVICKN